MPSCRSGCSVTDAANKVVYARIAQLAAHTQAAFGPALKLDSLSPWAGLRPATPSSLPIIGRTSLDNDDLTAQVRA